MLRQLGIHAITCGYVLFNALRVIAYVPQIRKLCASEGASGVSAASWLMFAGAHGSTALYAFGIQRDYMLALLTSVNFVCSMSIAWLAFHRQRQGAREAAAVAAMAPSSDSSSIVTPACAVQSLPRPGLPSPAGNRIDPSFLDAVTRDRRRTVQLHFRPLGLASGIRVRTARMKRAA